MKIERAPRLTTGGYLAAIALCGLIASPADCAQGQAVPELSNADATFATIRTLDLALAGIGDRLVRANAPLCDRVEPDLGLVLHTPSQYARNARAGARRYFRFDGPVGVEGVVGQGARAAGLQPDDTLLAIDGTAFALDDPAATTGAAALIAARSAIARLPSDRPLTVEGRRRGAAMRWTVMPAIACVARFEVAIGGGFDATADGEMVQIGDRFLTRYPEDQVAAVVAHELAHNILHHRARLEAQKVTYGMASGFGRNVRYFRQTELEADILSVSLLANAGYDPAAAVRFWQSFGPAQAGGPFISRSHPAWNDRVGVLSRAIAALGPDRPTIPAILARRDQPLDGNWQALLAR